MKLKKAHICNFRSIVDIDNVDLEERLTVLIGKNEQGKTTFLKALASFEPAYTYLTSDLPNHLSTNLGECSKADIPIMTLWFSPTFEGHHKLKDILPDIASITTFKITKYYDGHYTYNSVGSNGTDTPIRFAPPDISKQVEAIARAVETLRDKLGAHVTRQPSFAPHKPQADSQLDAFKKADFTDATQVDNLVNTVSTALTAVPGQDQPIQDDIAAFANEIRAAIDTLKPILAQNLLAKFLEFIPQFVYHSTSIEKIPNEVNIADFIKDPEKTSKGMANLCRAAGLTMPRITELANTTDTNRRHVGEDQYTKNISGGINEYWMQENYEVQFQCEKDRLTVSISDETYTWRIPPSERSDGFQWYLSFYSAVLSTVSGPKPTVLLLDNPGLELHADGQRDIKKFLEEKLPWNTQIIYVTHSPAMIDAYQLEQVREVELLGKEQGTKIRKLRIKSGSESDLLEPVRSAIGASLVTSLMFNEFNILVEGASDKPILEGAFAATQKDAAKKIVINGSIAESKEWLPLIYERAKLPYVVYLDADSSGRDLVKSLTGADVPKEKIILLNEAVKRDGDFELEDIFSDDFYHKAVSETYPEQSIPQPPPGAGKRTKRYECLFKEQLDFDFTKRRVAVTIKKLLLENKADEESKKAVTELTEKLLKTLQAQVLKEPPAANPVTA